MGRTRIIFIGLLLWSVALPCWASTRVLFVGDMMFDRTVATRMKQAKNVAYPFARIGSLRSVLAGDGDVILGNLEGPIVTKRRPPEKEIDFGFATSVAPLLARMGFNAVSQANNHTLDQGRAGADESKTFLLQAGVLPFGDQTRESATSSIGWLTTSTTKFAVMGMNITDHPFDQKRAMEILGSATSTGAPVIVFMHWGTEYRAKPSATQIAIAHQFIDAGAMAVIGAHPHWMQSVEVYHGRPIAYSLGNFIFDQDWSTETREGLAVRLQWDAVEMRMTLLPVHIEASQPSLLTGKVRDARLQRLASISDRALKASILHGEIAIPLQPWTGVITPPGIR